MKNEKLYGGLPVTVPESVAMYVRKRRTARIVICLVLLIGVAAFAIFGKAVYGSWKLLNIILTFAAAIVLILALTGVPVKLKDKSWFGTVTKVKVDTCVGFETKGCLKTSSSIFYKTDTQIELTVATPSGTEKQTVWKQPCKFQAPEEKYREGDTVCLIDGTKYLYREPVRPNDRAICVVCGADNASADVKCALCGYELIKNREK